MIYYILEFINFIIFFIGLSSLLTFFFPFFFQAFIWNKEQNLKKKYNAEWALVTGASSGIGRALTEKLASQGISVVMVALDDDLLKNFHNEISSQYPNLKFRAIGCDLGTDTYMQKIIQNTEDIQISLLFNNAGYVLIGLFADTPLEKILKNIECNQISAVKITHHFLNKMISAKIRGCVTFTSSSSGYLAAPTTSMYVSTKIFLTNFACSLAGEVISDGIDVLVIQPSPVDTNFYKAEKMDKHDTLRFFGRHGQSPTVIAQTIFSSVGRGGPNRDQGVITFGVKILMKIIDYNLLALMYNFITPIQKEYKSDRKSVV